jgi:hypothetical protein
VGEKHRLELEDWGAEQNRSEEETRSVAQQCSPGKVKGLLSWEATTSMEVNSTAVGSVTAKKRRLRDKQHLERAAPQQRRWKESWSPVEHHPLKFEDWSAEQVHSKEERRSEGWGKARGSVVQQYPPERLEGLMLWAATTSAEVEEIEAGVNSTAAAAGSVTAERQHLESAARQRSR